MWFCGIHGWTKGHYFSHDCCPLFVCCRLILQRRIKYLIMIIIVWQLLRYLHSQDVVHKLLDIIRRISTSSSAKLPAPWWAEWLLIISSVLLHFHCFCTVQCIKLAFFFVRVTCYVAFFWVFNILHCISGKDFTTVVFFDGRLSLSLLLFLSSSKLLHFLTSSADENFLIGALSNCC